MNSDFILQNLNEPQQEAVKHHDGPMLVFAGAGSGKTRVITNRIAYLIHNFGVTPYNILAVTFTKKAAEEMKNRVTSLLKQTETKQNQTPLIGTFHSIAALFLRKDGHHVGLDRNFTIIDQDDSENLIKEIMKDYDLDPKKFKPKAIKSYIEDAKNNLVPADEYSYNYGGFFEDVVADIYPEYQNRLAKLNSVDFGDLLFKAVLLLKNNDEILAKYQQNYPYILVDEYQDTNKAQYEFIKLLAGSTQNLCVVGDDDQGIYKWRGADIKNIINFQNDFADVKVIKLEQNYRSTANIINAAITVIKRNNQRVDKSLWTSQGEGEKITIYQAQNESDEANFVVDEIEELQDSGRTLNDFAVLYRTNYQSRAIEEALLKRNIPYKLVGGFRFYDRKEIKDLLSYLRFVANPKDDLSLLRVINVPTRKIGAKSVSVLTDLAKKNNCTVSEMLILSYWLKKSDLPLDLLDEKLIPTIEAIQTDLAPFEKVIEIFGEVFFESQGQPAVKILKNIISKIRYYDFINDGTEQGEMRVENVEELKNVAATYGSDATSLYEFLEGVALIESEQDKNASDDAENNRVTLMTLHSSKGLEYPVVFITGMEEGLLPHSRSFTEPDELEEERRLCYVGITRAKERLFMTFAENRMTGMGSPFGRVPSRFLGEIPQDICDFYSWSS